MILNVCANINKIYDTKKRVASHSFLEVKSVE